MVCSMVGLVYIRNQLLHLERVAIFTYNPFYIAACLSSQCFLRISLYAAFWAVLFIDLPHISLLYSLVQIISVDMTQNFYFLVNSSSY